MPKVDKKQIDGIQKTKSTHNFGHGAAQDAFEEGGLQLVMLRTGHESRECAKHYATHDRLRTLAVQNNQQQYLDPENWIWKAGQEAKEKLMMEQIILDTRHQVLGLQQQQLLQEDASRQHLLDSIEQSERQKEEFWEDNNNREEEIPKEEEMMLSWSKEEILRKLAETTKNNTALFKEVSFLKQRKTSLEVEVENLKKEIETQKQHLVTRGVLASKQARRDREDLEIQKSSKEGVESTTTIEEMFENLQEKCKTQDYPVIFKIRKNWSKVVAESKLVHYKRIEIVGGDFDLLFYSQ